MKKNKWKPLIGMVLVFVTAGSFFLTGCSEGTKENKAGRLAVSQRSLLLKSGETIQLEVTGGTDVKFESKNTEVAAVDQSGYVKAKKKGNTLITISSDDEKIYCGVLVDMTGTMLDITDMQVNAVLSEMKLYHSTELIGLGVDTKENAFYFSQHYGKKVDGVLKSDSVLTKVEQNEGEWKRTERMYLYNHGYGYFALERDGQDTYLVTESNGTYQEEGQTISRVKWEDKSVFDKEFGQTWDFSEITGSVSAQIDEENQLAAIRVVDDRESYYLIYDYQGMKNGEEPFYLHKVTCAGYQEPKSGTDDSRGRYNSTIRGFVFHDGYIYQLSGRASIHISVFDLKGNLQYCHRVTEYPELTYRCPSALAYADGKLYLAVTSGTETLYLANVWSFEGEKR